MRTHSFCSKLLCDLDGSPFILPLWRGSHVGFALSQKWAWQRHGKASSLWTLQPFSFSNNLKCDKLWNNHLVEIWSFTFGLGKKVFTAENKSSCECLPGTHSSWDLYPGIEISIKNDVTKFYSWTNMDSFSLWHNLISFFTSNHKHLPLRPQKVQAYRIRSERSHTTPTEFRPLCLIWFNHGCYESLHKSLITLRNGLGPVSNWHIFKPGNENLSDALLTEIVNIKMHAHFQDYKFSDKQQIRKKMFSMNSLLHDCNKLTHKVMWLVCFASWMTQWSTQDL